MDNDIALLLSTTFRLHFISATYVCIFIFLRIGKVSRTMPIPRNDMRYACIWYVWYTALHIDYECLCDKLARKQYSFKSVNTLLRFCFC